MSRARAALGRLMGRMACQYGQFNPSQGWLAAQLKRDGFKASLRSVNRWISDLTAADGIFEVAHCGPKSSTYKLRQKATPKSIKYGVANGVAFGVAKAIYPYMNSSRLNGEERKPPSMEQRQTQRRGYGIGWTDPASLPAEELRELEEFIRAHEARRERRIA